MAREALATWEKVAGTFSDSMVRDPRNLELGASMLRLGLMWKRTTDQFVGHLISMALQGPGAGSSK
jgi:hypothetical protein